MLNASGVTGAGRKVLITQAGQEGLVVFVLNVDDRWMNGLSMLATMFSRLDIPNCDLVSLRLLSSSLRQDDTEDIFLSLFIVETKTWQYYSSFSFFFSRVQHE